MSDKYKISKRRKNELEQELNFLKTTRNREVEAMIAEAMEYGDLENNAEYDATKSEQRKLHGRIAELEKILSCAVIVEEEEKRLSEDILGALKNLVQKCGLSAKQADSYAEYCRVKFEEQGQEQYGALPAKDALETLKEAQKILNKDPRSSQMGDYEIDHFLHTPSNHWQSAKNAIMECFGCTRDAVDMLYNEDPDYLLLSAEAVYESAKYLEMTLSDVELSWKIFQRGAIFGTERFKRIAAIMDILGVEYGKRVIRADAAARGWIFWGYYSDPVECLAYMKECGLTPVQILAVIQKETDFLYMYRIGRKLSYGHDQAYIDRVIQRYRNEFAHDAEMIKYEFYCRDVLLGHLYIRDKQHCFIPILEHVNQVKQQYPLPWEVIRGYEWGKPIPFFQERIENATRFGMEKLIRYHTDEFVMRIVEASND